MCSAEDSSDAGHYSPQQKVFVSSTCAADHFIAQIAELQRSLHHANLPGHAQSRAQAWTVE